MEDLHNTKNDIFQVSATIFVTEKNIRNFILIKKGLHCIWFQLHNI